MGNTNCNQPGSLINCFEAMIIIPSCSDTSKQVYFFLLFKQSQVFLPREGGYSDLFGFGLGVQLEPQNSYPSLRVILAEKGTHC